MPDSTTTHLPTLDYECGERWIHGEDKHGRPVVAPHMIQREGELFKDFIARIRRVEEALNV